MYYYEPSLSLDHEGPASSTDDGLGLFPDSPLSVSRCQDVEDKSVVVVSTEGEVEIEDDLEEKKGLPVDDEQRELSPEERALLPAPNSCPRSGLNLRRLSPTFGSTPAPPRLEDYLCTCKYCPRAMTIQRAFQLYGFALDHPQSDALLRVLRACANYDETIIEVDPLLVLHAEKMLEELSFDEDQTFRLLIASHFQRA
uniref:Uncharacterized protein n=1 Tax=Phytophthora ramorum TaxID=164328 RepID=H3GIC9_PHYRM